MLNPLSKIVSIGATRSGKSYMLKYFQAAYQRLIIIDGNCEYIPAKNYNNPEAIYCVGYAAFSIEFSKIVQLNQYCLIFQFADQELNEKQIVEKICERIYRELGDTMLVIEEAHDYCDTHNHNTYFRKLATKGGHKGIGYMLSTQRPSLINKTLLTQCDYILIFNLVDPNDILYVKSFIGEKSKLVSSLQPRNFIMYHRPENAPVSITIENSNNLIIK